MTANGASKWLMVLAALALSACGAETDTTRGGPQETMEGAIDPITGLPVNPTPGQAGTTAGDGTVLPGVGTGTGGTSSVTPAVDGTPIPCDVQNVVANNCHTCHGATPVGGAVRLVTYEDFHKPSPFYGPTKLMDTTKQIYEVAKIRINNGEMPQNKTMAPADLTMLDTWLGAGALAGTAADETCMMTTPIDPGPIGPQDEVYCDRPGGRDPLVARAGETCYEFLTHGANGESDTSPFTVGLNESYSEIHYTIPWKQGDLMTRFGADFDNLPVLHHYLLFHSHAGAAPGSIVKNVSGTTIGTEARLIAGWAVGGCGQEYPPEVGMWLPDPTDGHIMIQWHHFNTTGAPQPDSSKVQVCTVPAGTRPNVGDVTHLGTENFNSIIGMPPGPSSFTSQCANNSGKDAFVVGWMPHMHLLGVNMKTVLKRADGTMETVFDKPFKFDYQIGYAEAPALKVAAGEALITTCSFVNTTGANVAFGQSTKSEMCYQFASYYPIGSLVNGTPSLLGSKNTCW